MPPQILMIFCSGISLPFVVRRSAIVFWLNRRPRARQISGAAHRYRRLSPQLRLARTQGMKVLHSGTKAPLFGLFHTQET
jgi:hypothetical protein